MNDKRNMKIDTFVVCFEVRRNEKKSQSQLVVEIL